MNLKNKTDKELWDMLDKLYPKWINPSFMIRRNVNYLDNKAMAKKIRAEIFGRRNKYDIHKEIIRRENEKTI